VSPLVGGTLAAHHFGAAQVLGLLTVPVIACALSMLSLPRVAAGK
jgi:hypothetical protein